MAREQTTKESTIQAGIIRHLKQAGAWYTKVHNAGYGRKGIPDILACYRGVMLAIEVKNEEGRPSQEQVIELNAIRDAGGVAIIARSWDEVHLVIDLIDSYLYEIGGKEAADDVVQHTLPQIRRVRI